MSLVILEMDAFTNMHLSNKFYLGPYSTRIFKARANIPSDMLFDRLDIFTDKYETDNFVIQHLYRFRTLSDIS